MKDLNSKEQIEELKQLLNTIEAYNLKDIDLDIIAPCSEELAQNDFIEILRTTHEEYIIIDVRSEDEFLESKIPFSVNLPILNNIERHNVGLIYAKHSRKRAVSLAYYYALQKEKLYIESIKNLTAGKSGKVIIYCWRGGRRSKYVAELFRRNNIEAVILNNGYKGFRKVVYEYLYNKTIPIISLSGLTGCGKSEILEYIQEKYPSFPVLHLEECAGHASSVFGEIRFFLMGKKTCSQQQFETNIFMRILPYLNKKNNLPLFLSEKESRKIGKLVLPPAVYQSLEQELHIAIICCDKDRIKRLSVDYFAVNSSEGIKNIAKEKVRQKVLSFKKRYGNEKIEQYLSLLDKGQYSEFLEDILKIHYDPVYRKAKKEAIAVIEHNRMDSTVDTIFKVMEGIL
ncbi:MAG: tRNA 2-selenouridine(34) synthase MnmH [Spirochaetes bacterium]|nr:tRNA 2-selenouridine(34) synthase MnmH [Spirochaetota bacterium]